MSINNQIISKLENEEEKKNNKENEYESKSTEDKEYIKISNNFSKKEPIYIMNLELEKGKPEKIKIFSDSDPNKIASDFCREHNLDYNGLDYLRKKIEALLKQNNINLIDKKNEIIKQPLISENNLQNNKNNFNSIINEKKFGKNKNNKINDLTSPIQKIQGKISAFDRENICNKNYINNKNSFSKKKGHKYKARIQNIENSDKIFDKIYQEIQNKSNKNENIYNNNSFSNHKTKENTDYMNERINKLKLEREKEISQIEKHLSKVKNNNRVRYESKANSTIKNNKKRNYFNLSQNSKHKYNSKKIDNRISKILKEYEEKYSFHPSINENYKTDLTFEQRQEIYNNLYLKKREELKNFYLNSKKDENGNIFFRPKLISKQNFKNEENKTINNNETNKNEIKDNDIFSKNYFYWKKYSLDKEELFAKYYDNNKYEPVIFTKIKNEKLINQTKMRAFKNLFKDLDGDQDDLINAININIKKIPNKVYKIIEPLINELKEDNQSLNKEEFLIAMNKLFDDISSMERAIIINIYSKKLKKNKSLGLYNSFSKDNNKIRMNTPSYYISNYKLKSIPYKNNNTNKLAFKHYKKIKKMYGDLFKINTVDNYFNSSFNSSKNEKININKYSGTVSNKVDENFICICNCTFNNYIRKLD